MFVYSLIYIDINGFINYFFIFKKRVYFFIFLIYTSRSKYFDGGDGMMNVDVLWSNFKNQIKEELTSLAYNTWFKDTELYKLNDGIAYIIVPMPIHKKHLMENFSNIMKEKLF